LKEVRGYEEYVLRVDMGVCGGFLTERFLVRDAFVETLLAQNAELNLRHIEPAAMFRLLVNAFIILNA